MPKKRPGKRAKAKKKWVPYATLLLLGMCVIGYLVLSGGEAYVYPLEKLDALGVSRNTPIGALTYAFLHIGIKHLIGNALLILGMGLIVERMLGWKDTLSIYLISGIGAGLMYVMLYANALVIGSSAAISGLIATAYIVDVKRGFVVLALALLLVPSVIYPAVDDGLDWLTASHMAEELEKDAEKQVVEERLASVTKEIEAGNATPENLEKAQQLTLLAEAIEQERAAIVIKKQTVVVGRTRAAATPVSFEIHVMGMVLAMAYLVMMRRNAFTKFQKDFKGIWRWVLGIIEP